MASNNAKLLLYKGKVLDSINTQLRVLPLKRVQGKSAWTAPPKPSLVHGCRLCPRCYSFNQVKSEEQNCKNFYCESCDQWWCLKCMVAVRYMDDHEHCCTLTGDHKKHTPCICNQAGVQQVENGKVVYKLVGGCMIPRFRR